MKVLLLIIASAVGFGSLPAHADCSAPAPMIRVPDGATASRHDMLAAMHAVQQYNEAVTSYVHCLRDSGDNLMPANFALADLRRIADRFNAQLRIFKARSGA